MTIYYTVNNEYTMIDSISYDFEALKKKFPDKEIFITDELESIYDIQC